MLGWRTRTCKGVCSYGCCCRPGWEVPTRVRRKREVREWRKEERRSERQTETGPLPGSDGDA